MNEIDTSKFDEVLEKLDLRGNKAKLYTEILINPGSTASEISENTGVAKNKIYQLLDDLFSNNLIFMTQDRPKKYWPVEIEELLKAKMDDVREELNSLNYLKKSIGEILEELYKSNKQGDQERISRLANPHPAFIEVVLGPPERHFKTLYRMICGSKESLLFLGDWNDFKVGIANQISEKVGELHNSGVKIDQILSFQPDFFNESNLKEIEFLASKEKVIGDRRPLYYLISQPLSFGLVLIDDIGLGLYIKNPVLNSFNFSVYIESTYLINRVKLFLKSIQKELYKSIIDLSQQFGLIPSIT